ncbi:MAG: protein translocase subunit SecF, partial [Alloalcanivorax venustensis]
APVIRSPITAGRGQISGGFDAREAGDLALLLRAGALPAPLEVVEQRTVGPDLGGDQIRMGVTTGLIGAALVLAFMVLAYRRWGLIANTALVINLGLVIGLLASLGATLTLPGIAGLILSVGMAVDANILINERIREEARRGRSGQGALRAGFQRAYATILDSNITTLIAVGLLFQFGAGPVRGFAVTMAVGLLVSLFTSISVTRLLMEWRLRHRTRGTLTLPGPDWLGAENRRRPIRFMAVRGRGIVLSLVLSVASLAALAWPGLNTGIDFQGGVAMEVHTPVSIDTLRSGLAASGLEGSLQRFGDDGEYLLRLPAGADSDARVEAARAALSTVSPEASYPRLEVVGPSVSGGFVETSILAVLLAGAGMLVYLRLRFAAHFAWAALITLGLDLSKTLGFLVLTGLEFNLTTVAALLTLIGYSVNDKVVVFDRMRENRALDPERPLEDIIDLSLTQTLRRTLFTSMTTFLAILPMGLAGGPAVTSFALPVLFGIVVGTSSSMFIAAPMAMFLERWFSPEGPAAREPASLESESGYL